MILTIDLNPEIASRLQSLAEREGVDASTVVERTLAEHLPPVSAEDRTLELFAKWQAEDGTDDPDEIASRNREWEEMKRHLEANRLSLPVPEV